MVQVRRCGSVVSLMIGAVLLLCLLRSPSMAETTDSGDRRHDSEALVALAQPSKADPEVSHERRPFAPRPRAAVRRVAVLGDSIIADGALVRSLGEQLGSSWKVDNYGVNCESPRHMVRRIRTQNSSRKLEKSLDPTKYDFVIVLAGVNGIRPDVDSANGARTQLARLFARLKASGEGTHAPKVVGLTLLPWGGWKDWSVQQEAHTKAINGWLLGASESDAATAVPKPPVDMTVDIYSALVEPGSVREADQNGVIRPRMSSKYTADGLHLSIHGANFVAALLREALVGQSSSEPATSPAPGNSAPVAVAPTTMP